MLVKVTRDKGQFFVNKGFTNNVPELADLVDAEGEKCMAMIAYLFDPADDNPWSSLPKEIRIVEVLSSMGYDKSILKKDVVKKAAAKYEVFCSENIPYKLKASYEQGMHKLAKFIGKVDELTDDNAKEFAGTLKLIPDLLKGKNDLEKLGNKEQEQRGKVRGQKELTAAEKM